MSNLLDLSGKIDAASLALFETVNELSGSVGVRYFVVGATARDMILELGHQRRSQRATLDVDVGVRVGTWDEFMNLKEELLRSGQFAITKDVQRVQYRGGMLLDILPFGDIADVDGTIHWPPEGDFTMSVLGFDDAYQAAEKVRVRGDPPLDIWVASLAGLSLMKIISWSDRPTERIKDARDLAHIFEHYLDAGNYERLLDNHMDIVDVDGFDYVLGGARLLGRDIASIGKPETLEKVKRILQRQMVGDGQLQLVQAMMADSAAATDERENEFEKKLAWLKELKAGIEEK